MAEIVAAIGCAHAPGIATRPEPDAEGMKERVYAGYRRGRELLAEAHPDKIIVVSNEHLQNFFFDNWPTLLVAFPETMQGPYESWMPIPQVTLQGYPEFGSYLLRSALGAHFDLASSQELRPDHGVILPLHHLRPEMDLPVTIILQNCVQPPLPTLRRCYEFGRFLGQAIANWPRPDRFALIGVGGISHWIGTKGTGRIDADWDRWFLDLVCSGRTEDIANLPPESIEREAGNGGEEIRNWLTVMAALGNPRADLIAYEPVADWICCGAVVNFQVNGQH
jgi:aromatic ring-opening dioxygenase catalytic subunit (LigB family)